MYKYVVDVPLYSGANAIFTVHILFDEKEIGVFKTTKDVRLGADELKAQLLGEAEEFVALQKKQEEVALAFADGLVLASAKE